MRNKKSIIIVKKMIVALLIVTKSDLLTIFFSHFLAVDYKFKLSSKFKIEEMMTLYLQIMTRYNLMKFGEIKI